MSDTPTWFLLYTGESEDGRGPGTYAGRTTDVKVARRHHEDVRRSPYSVGYVEAITDTKHGRICWLWEFDAIESGGW